MRIWKKDPGIRDEAVPRGKSKALVAVFWDSLVLTLPIWLISSYQGDISWLKKTLKIEQSIPAGRKELGPANPVEPCFFKLFYCGVKTKNLGVYAQKWDCWVIWKFYYRPRLDAWDKRWDLVLWEDLEGAGGAGGGRGEREGEAMWTQGLVISMYDRIHYK